MPRALDYRLAAHSFRVQRDRLEEAARRDRSVDSLTGPLAAHTTVAHFRLRRLLLTAGGEFAELAASCDRRADACDAYAAEVAAYERLDVWERIRAARPRPPAAWVDA